MADPACGRSVTPSLRLDSRLASAGDPALRSGKAPRRSPLVPLPTPGGACHSTRDDRARDSRALVGPCRRGPLNSASPGGRDCYVWSAQLLIPAPSRREILDRASTSSRHSRPRLRSGDDRVEAPPPRRRAFRFAEEHSCRLAGGEEDEGNACPAEPVMPCTASPLPGFRLASAARAAEHRPLGPAGRRPPPWTGVLSPLYAAPAFPWGERSLRFGQEAEAFAPRPRGAAPQLLPERSEPPCQRPLRGHLVVIGVVIPPHHLRTVGRFRHERLTA